MVERVIEITVKTILGECSEVIEVPEDVEDIDYFVSEVASDILREIIAMTTDEEIEDAFEGEGLSYEEIIDEFYSAYEWYWHWEDY